ncbi:MAG: RidA family protein [Gammaproteobacteria bacterium]|nr:RidA family protein [Gammaproteobacteria bacterium]
MEELGLTLPQPMNVDRLPFELVRIVGDRALIAGHVPLNDDGTVAMPFGKVGDAVTAEEAYHAARRVALGMLSSLRTALGDLDRVDCWVRLFGMVNVAPGFSAIPPVINGCSDVILEVFGENGRHTRSAVGMAELPFGVPVECEGEVKILL